MLDLGAGTGVHGLMAARMGARRVYLVEPEDIISVAEEIAEANGLRDRVQCIQGRIEDVSLPERVDVIVSVLTGNFLVTEDLLQTLFYARDHVLKPGGVLIPSAATMEAAPVSAAKLHAESIGAWSVSQHGVDLAAARPYAGNTVFYRSEELRRRADARRAAGHSHGGLPRDGYDAVKVETTYEVTTTGICHGWVGWCSMKLGDTVAVDIASRLVRPLVSGVSSARPSRHAHAWGAGRVHAEPRSARRLDLGHAHPSPGSAVTRRSCPCRWSREHFVRRRSTTCRR